MVHNLNTQTRRLIHLEAVISWNLQAALDASATVHDPNWLMNELLGGSGMVGSLEMGSELTICLAWGIPEPPAVFFSSTYWWF